jgi:PAS domain S-box-containing protein
MISANATLTGSYDYGEVARSVFIAIVASYAALDLAGRATAAGARVRFAWLSCGAIAMGIGIWAMHFKGMLAFHLPVPVEYHWPTVLASVLVAVLASAVALYVASRHKTDPVEALTGSMLMGAGIAGMHYIGMAAMRLPAITRYSPLLVTCSVFLVILFSLIALPMAFDLREESRWSVPRRLGSATLMGVGVSAMHYTGMAAASFIPASPPDLSHAVSISPFGSSAVVIATLIVLLAAVTTSSVDRRRTEDRLRLVIETAPAMLHSARPDGYVDFFNKRWLEYVGLSLEDIQGWRWTNVFHPEDVEDTVGKWRSSLATGKPFEAEARLRRADGEYRLILLRKVPLRDEVGSIVKWYGSAIDIEDRRQAEEEVERSEERYRVIVEAASDAVISMDESGGILLANPATARIFGYDPVELIGKPLTILMPEFMRKLHETGFRQYLATGERHLNWQGTEVTALHKNGQEFPVEVSFGEMTRNGHKAFTGFVRDISEKKRAKDELRSQKEVFQKIFENIPVTISFIGADGHIELVNPQWERTMGWTLEEIHAQSLDFFAEAHPDAQYRQIVLDFIARSTGEWIDRKVRVRDGRVIDLVVSVVHLSDGTSVAIGRDITERKRSEDELRRQKELFQTIFENIPVMIAFFGKDGQIELVNPEWERTMGWTLKEIREHNLDIFAEAYPDPKYRQMARGFAASTTAGHAELNVRVRDGRVINMAADVAQLSDGSTLGIGRDITERKRSEAELRESEARFRLVADSAPVMIWMSGTDKLCTYFNKPWLDFTGRSIDRELGNGWAEGVDPEDLQKCLDTYIQFFDRREAFKMEYRLRRHDGEFRWILDIGVPRFNPDGSFAGYIGSCIDVTEQRRAQEQLHQAQEDLARVTRVIAMGELAAAIAHEVNQPLTAIVTNGHFCLRTLDRATSNPNELRAAITAIVNDGTRASGVISRIRGLLMKGFPNRTDLDINQIIQEVTILLRNEFTRNRVSLRTELPSDLPRVTGDPVQLQQVLINLIMNAIEATHTSTNGRREILIRSAKNSDDVLVRVQDSGPGIKPELAPRIFEPFFTTKAKGIGMGLSISQSIIESHGGRLGIAPSSTGALFEFTLPIDDAGVS